VVAFRPSGAGWEADIEARGAVLYCHLADRPATGAGELEITLLDPPCFGPDGALLPQASA